MRDRRKIISSRAHINNLAIFLVHIKKINPMRSLDTVKTAFPDNADAITQSLSIKYRGPNTTTCRLSANYHRINSSLSQIMQQGRASKSARSSFFQ